MEKERRKKSVHRMKDVIISVLLLVIFPNRMFHSFHSFHSWSVMARISSRRLSIITDYPTTVFTFNISPLLPSLSIPPASLSDQIHHVLLLWRTQQCFLTFFHSLTQTYLHAISPRELYMILWGDGVGYQDLQKRLRQVLMSSQNREQFETSIAQLEQVLHVWDYHHESS